MMRELFLEAAYTGIVLLGAVFTYFAAILGGPLEALRFVAAMVIGS